MKKQSARWVRREAALLAAALSLSACGGGGGNVRPATAPPAPAPTPAPAPAPAPQPPLDAQLALTNTYAAHAQGFTGQGITIGVVDSGIMHTHPALTGRVDQELIYVDPTANNTAIDDVVGHGTWVSEIAAGKAFDIFPGGIAPDANLVSARIISDKEPTDDGTGQGNQVTAADADFFGKTLNPDLIAAGVQVQNNSWGGIYWNTTDASINQAFAQAYDPFVLQHGGLVVFAAGNEGNSDPSTIAALPSLAPELEKGWLVAVAADSLHPTQLASYSNACGKAMNYCLTAPGDVVVSGKDDTATKTNYYIVQGTSFAAPEVSGAAALVWQAYPYFDNDLVRQTLLGTAKDLGAPGVDPVFGYGMLDAGKAVNGPSKFDWGDVTVNFSGNSSWNNPISGGGGLIKQGSGTLNLTQPSSYTGQTQVQGGTLTAKALASGVSISAGATLSGTQAIGGSVTNAGVLGVSGSNVTVAGNYAQQGAGRLAVSLGSALNVTGTASLGGGDLFVTGTNSGYVVSSHTTVLTAGGGLSGTFSALTTASNVLLQASLGYDANNAWLNVQQVQVTAVQGMSYTAASLGSAQRVQGAFNQLDSQLTQAGAGSASGAGFIGGAASLQQSPSLAAAQRSLESLSGQLHAASAAMTFEAIDAGTRALSDRFDHLLDAPARNGFDAGAWTQNLGYHGGMARSGYSQVGVDLDGWLAGQDVRLGPNGVAGFALSQSQGLGRLAESADQGHSHALEAMLYGGLVHGQAYLMGRFGVGTDRETMRRTVELGSQFDGVASDSRARYGVAYAESGYRLGLAGVQITPYANLQYARIQHDGFNELGGDGFGLKANAQTVQRWQAGVGVRAARQWALASGGSLSLQAHLLWQQAFGLRGDVFDASFTGIEQWAPLGGIGLSRYGGVAGMALDWNPSQRSTLQFGLDQHTAQHAQATMATLSYRLAF